MLDWILVTQWVIRDLPEYHASIDEFMGPKGEQFLQAHVRFHKHSPATMRKALADWKLFRSICTAPLFACAGPDEETGGEHKWEKFITLLGFKFFKRLKCSNGLRRRFYVSLPNGILQRHQ